MISLEYELARLSTRALHRTTENKYLHRRSLPPPSYVIWDCTRRCNLACSHCGATKESYSRELTTAQILGVLNQLAQMGVRMFALTGGEPLLREDLQSVLAQAQSLGLQTGLATNGFLLTNVLIQKFQALGVRSIQVSLDGPEALHDEIRGKAGSFQRATSALRALSASGIPLVMAATTVTAKNLTALPELRQILMGLGLKQWRISVVMPIGRAESRYMMLSPAQLRDLFHFVSTQSMPGFRIHIGENLPFLGSWERVIRKAPFTCPIGFSACCIGVDGMVRGCPEQADIAENQEGSVLEDAFSEIWARGFEKYRLNALMKEDHACKNCRDQDPCYGGCWVMRSADQHCIHHLLSG